MAGQTESQIARFLFILKRTGINSYSWGERKVVLFVLNVFCPQAGLALPFLIDEIAIRANAHTNRKCINGYSIG